MKIIWADHDPSWGVSNPAWDVPSREEAKAEVTETQDCSRTGVRGAQEKGLNKEAKGFG